ncbi:MAG: chemotaxis protein CheD [Desulfosudaceae bacterium]
MKNGSQCHPGSFTAGPGADIYLKQGEYYISDGGPAQVRTVLGSCVTVTMHCPIMKIGALTHSLLPYPLPNTTLLERDKGRYVNSSITYIFEKLIARGVSRSRLEVKIFGGGQMMLPVPGKEIHAKLNIGRRNVETALKIIQQLGLNITATDVGGHHGRKLLFFPQRGDVWVKKINRTVSQAGVSHD